MLVLASAGVVLEPPATIYLDGGFPAAQPRCHRAWPAVGPRAVSGIKRPWYTESWASYDRDRFPVEAAMSRFAWIERCQPGLGMVTVPVDGGVESCCGAGGLGR
jgi:hypothetical protein